MRSFSDILEPLVASIDADGSIMDSASTLLRETRRAKRSLAGRIRKKIEEIIRDSGIEKFLQDDFITQRSGRWVIPVRMDSKGMVKGWCMMFPPRAKPPSWSLWRSFPSSMNWKT